MKTFAKITAIALIVLGILLMLGGPVLALTSAFSLRQVGAVVNRLPPRSGLTNLGILIALGTFIHGLVLMASGQGLYLLVSLAPEVKDVPPKAKK